MNYFASGSQTYEEVAEKAGLTKETKKRYVAYMRTRWASSENEKCLVGYAGEWALRFKDNREFECSDSIGQTVLQQLKT